MQPEGIHVAGDWWVVVWCTRSLVVTCIRGQGIAPRARLIRCICTPSSHTSRQTHTSALSNKHLIALKHSEVSAAIAYAYPRDITTSGTLALAPACGPARIIQLRLATSAHNGRHASWSSLKFAARPGFETNVCRLKFSSPKIPQDWSIVIPLGWRSGRPAIGNCEALHEAGTLGW